MVRYSFTVWLFHPLRFAGYPALSDTHFVSIDICPTLCDLVGIPVPAHCKDRGLSAVMRGERVTDSEVAFLMNQGGGNAEAEAGAIGASPVNPLPQGKDKCNNRSPAAARVGEGNGYGPANFRGLRSRTHTYAVAQDGRWFLFDNVKDPYQQDNLIDDAAQKPLIDHFDSLIANWLVQADDPFDYAAAIRKRSSEPA